MSTGERPALMWVGVCGESASASPRSEVARAFGGQLAVTDDAGAFAFGAGPDGWDRPGFFGPLSQPLPMSLARHSRWGEFYAEERLAPMVELASDRLDASTRAAVGAVVKRCLAGDFDDGDVPCRLHGDLWSGNVMWTRDGLALTIPLPTAGIAILRRDA